MKDCQYRHVLPNRRADKVPPPTFPSIEAAMIRRIITPDRYVFNSLRSVRKPEYVKYSGRKMPTIKSWEQSLSEQPGASARH